MRDTDSRAYRRKRRHERVRKRLEGVAEHPRLCVFRSSRHIYAQVVDDWAQCTIVAASSLSPELKGEGSKGSTVADAARVGALVARKCIEKGIKAVVFDRGGYKYHGRVKALADAARAQFKEAGAAGF